MNLCDMASMSIRARSGLVGLFSVPAIIAALLTAAWAQAPGGFIEHSTNPGDRPTLTGLGEVPQGRGPFTFPCPYNTEGIKITIPGDCAAASPPGDCVWDVAYSYWRNMNNHVGSNLMYIFLGLARERGGAGPTLFSYNKVTEEVRNEGPLFALSDPLSWYSGNGWYFSATLPTKLYVYQSLDTKLRRFDVLTRQFESSPVFDLDGCSDCGLPGTRYIWQVHSSDDDQVHSATVRDKVTFQMLGCVAHRQQQFYYFPKRGLMPASFDECHIDKSGRWLLILENVDDLNGEDNRIIDLDALPQPTERVLLDEDGAAGHHDMGYGYMVAHDNWASLPSSIKFWDYGLDPLQGTLVTHNTNWAVAAANHVSHTNAKPTGQVPPQQQYACGSGVSRVAGARGNEIICFRQNSSLDVLVVAPVMTNLDAVGGDPDGSGNDYMQSPKGNLDVTGQYFIWTSNNGGPRLDAFLVKVPSGRFTAPVPQPSCNCPLCQTEFCTGVDVGCRATGACEPGVCCYYDCGVFLPGCVDPECPPNVCGGCGGF